MITFPREGLVPRDAQLGRSEAHGLELASGVFARAGIGQHVVVRIPAHGAAQTLAAYRIGRQRDDLVASHARGVGRPRAHIGLRASIQACHGAAPDANRGTSSQDEDEKENDVDERDDRARDGEGTWTLGYADKR